jgi:hypothetical protein
MLADNANFDGGDERRNTNDRRTGRGETMKIIGGTDKDKEDETRKRADELAKAIIKMLPQHLSHRALLAALSSVLAAAFAEDGTREGVIAHNLYPQGPTICDGPVRHWRCSQPDYESCGQGPHRRVGVDLCVDARLRSIAQAHECFLNRKPRPRVRVRQRRSARR